MTYSPCSVTVGNTYCYRFCYRSGTRTGAEGLAIGNRLQSFHIIGAFLEILLRCYFSVTISFRNKYYPNPQTVTLSVTVPKNYCYAVTADRVFSRTSKKKPPTWEGNIQ